MNNSIKILIVAVLAAVVAIAVALKKGKPVAEHTVSVVPTETKLPKLLDLGAGKCIPCKMMAPILEELKKEYAGRMEVVFIDVWQTPDAGKQYGIDVIPTQIFYDVAGKELYRHVGFFAKDDILAKWRELAVNLGGK